MRFVLMTADLFDAFEAINPYPVLGVTKTKEERP